MKSLKIVSMIILAVFSLSMVSGAFATEYVTLNNNKNVKEKQLTVKVNETFKIKLESNPSTGYQWFSEYDSEFLKLIKSKYYPPEDTGETIAAGKPGTQKFVFKALKTGETDITMNYVRPWENGVPAEQIVYHVKITE
jgi:inhibitor of cysteine peptidase